MFDTKFSKYSDVHLDAMRGIAALIVVFGHSRGLFFPSFTAKISASHPGASGLHSTQIDHITIGHEAVMVFFVLSGYLVGGSVLNAFRSDRWQWRQYLIKRLVRLWIVLIPAIILGLAIDNIGFHFFSHIGGIYQSPLEQDYVTSHTFRDNMSLLTLIGNVIFLQGIFVPMSGTNVALWSLAYEFWYYVLFPICLIALWHDKPIATRIVALALALSIVWLIGPHAAYLFLTWVLGALLSLVPRKIPDIWAGKVTALSMVAFAILFTALKNLELPLPAGEMAIAGAAAILIYCIKCHISFARSRLYQTIAKFLSNLSYTLYLTHLPFLIFICSIINSPWRIWRFTPLTLMVFIAINLSAIVWAWLIYLLFESHTDRVRHYIERRLSIK